MPKDMDTLKHMKQPELFLSLKRDLALVSSLAHFTKSGFFSSPFFFITYSSVVYVQAIHEIFVAGEWVKDARNEAKVEANLRAKANRALRAAEQKNQELNAMLTMEEKA